MNAPVKRTGLPLSGITVIELGHSLAGPYACHILAHLGAEVIKVENARTGDTARGWGVVKSGDAAVMFHAVNCGKKSITADLRDPQSVAALKTLILKRADVVVQNMRAGGVDRYGLDAATLRKEKPELVYCNISAFGQVGPLRDEPGYDPLIQAVSGMMNLVGRPGDAAIRVPVPVNDMGSGMWAVIGVLGALIERQRDGQGATVDTSLYETALAWVTVQMSDYMNSGILPVRNGSGNANIVPYQAFRCADGEIMIAAGSDGLFRKLCVALDMPEYADSPKYATNSERITNKAELIALIEMKVLPYGMLELQELLERNGVPCGPINTMDRVADAEQTKALGIVGTTPEDGVRLVGIPLSFDSRRPPLAGRGPRLGENNDILSEE